jgi:hypothetical protein
MNDETGWLGKGIGGGGGVFTGKGAWSFHPARGFFQERPGKREKSASLECSVARSRMLSRLQDGAGCSAETSPTVSTGSCSAPDSSATESGYNLPCPRIVAWVCRRPPECGASVLNPHNSRYLHHQTPANLSFVSAFKISSNVSRREIWRIEPSGSSQSWGALPTEL